MIKLKSGREIYVSGGIVGISLDEEVIAEGYDGFIWTDEDSSPWTPAEKRELAEMMIARWKWWAERSGK